MSTANILYGTCSIFDDRKYTGPILDVDYEMESSYRYVPSLQDLCGKKIVSDSYLTRNYIHFIPSEIRVFIMNKALSEGRLPTVSFLMKNWPYSEFQFPRLPILKNWAWSCSYQNWQSLRKSFRRTLECVTTVLNVFLEIVQKGYMETRLKLVDLSAVPLSENDVMRICNYISDRGVSLSSHIDLEKVHAVEKYTIKVHCTLSSVAAAGVLYDALLAEKMELSPIKLSVYGLRFTNASLYGKNTRDLLDILNPADLQVLSFDFTSIKDGVMEEILLCLHRFHNLRVVDFAYCRFGELNQNNFPVMLRDQFKELAHISRLNFSGCNLGNYVSCMLEYLHKDKSSLTDTNDVPVASKKFKASCLNASCQRYISENLEYLNLSGCCITSGDLEYLARSSHTQNLKNLNLCSNLLGRHFNSLLILLRALAPSLYVLEIGDAYFREEDLVELVSALLEMKNLRFLNITHICASSQRLLLCLPQLCMIPLLRTLCLSVPRSVHLLDISHFRENVVKLTLSAKRNIDILWRD